MLKKLAHNANVQNFLKSFAIGIAIAMLAKTFAIDVFRVQGFSMSPAVNDGQIILVNKLSYGIANPFTAELVFSWKKPKKDDVVLYLYQNSWVVKRCVAIENTPLEYLSDSGYTLLVGEEKINLTSIQFHKMNSSKQVPEGYVLAIGDNSELSYDSRNYGFVPTKNIIGRVVVLKRGSKK